MQKLPSMTDGCCRVVSLVQIMIEYSINELVVLLIGLLSARGILKSAPLPTAPVPQPGWLQKLSRVLAGLQQLGEKIEIDPSLLNEIQKLKDEVGVTSCDLPALVIQTKLDYIIEGVQNNLESRKFMYMPRDQVPYWENAELFGDDFLIGFSTSAVMEMVEAGNCYAAGRWTASVFHSMRVAEHGLRSLAKGLRVTISNKGKNCPLEYGDWDTVITAIRNKITEIRKLPVSAKKEKLLQFYAGAADHCEYMKDIWRNEVSHTRRRYNKTDSLAVINRVKEFIQPLAKPDAKKRVRKLARLKVRQHLAALPSASPGAVEAMSNMFALFQSRIGSGEPEAK